MTEIVRPVLISNRRGLHARASAKFVTLASAQACDVKVEKEGAGSVTATSIMGLMMLGAAMGDTIVISASGEHAEAAVGALAELVLAKFGEDRGAPTAMVCRKRLRRGDVAPPTFHHGRLGSMCAGSNDAAWVEGCRCLPFRAVRRWATRRGKAAPSVAAAAALTGRS